ncbi:MAG: hypothetical protein ACFB0G_11340 [Leptolyngbyaceae cyanobacterium]
MVLDRQKQLLQEIMAEYDMETVVAALCEFHGVEKVIAQVKQAQEAA